VGMPFSFLATADLETTINQLSLTSVGIGSVLLVLLVIAAILLNKRKGKAKNKGKMPIFLGIVTVVMVTTLIISGGTNFLNINSYVGGPVHWHADTEFWVCGNEMELRNPQGFLSNKIGSPTLHEHNDKRIHLEGVPISAEDASLGKFMQVIGGELTDDTLVLPLDKTKLFKNAPNEQDGDGNATPAPELVERFLEDDGEYKLARMTTGQRCGDQPAELQVFVYQTDKAAKTYKQIKLNVPADYAISHYGDVPAGDCVIFEFGPTRDRTDKLCRQYGIRDIQQCGRFGVKPNERSICEYKEIK
jgi:hypothetical protein